MEKNKEEVKKRKKKFNKAKLITRLGILCIVLLIAKFILDKNLFDDMKIENRVNSYLPISVSIEEALTVKLYSIEKYANLINMGETKKAYSMLTEEYREYKSYSDFLMEIDEIDFTTFKLKEIKQMSTNTYIAPVIYKDRNGNEHEETYILLANKVNNKNIKISPNEFLFNFTEKVEFKEDDIKFTIENCEVFADNIKLTLKVKNNNFFKDVNIEGIGLEFAGSGVSISDIDDGIIESRKSKTYTVELDANYDIPKYLRINRNIDNEVMAKYKFKL